MCEGEGGREVDAFYSLYVIDTEACLNPARMYVRRLRLCPGIAGTESGQINFVVGDAFVVTEYCIL